jgi:hypothetical protein
MKTAFYAKLAIAFVCVSTCYSQSITLPPAPAGIETFTLHGLQFSNVQTGAIADFVPPADQPYPSVGRPVGGGTWNFGIARTELTQGSAIELPNAFYDVAVPQDAPWAFRMNTLLSGLGSIGPGVFGGPVGPQGRRRWTATAQGAALPASATGFFQAAAYCNGLHNDKQVTLDALLQGAYDLRNWNDAQPSTFFVDRSPNARFFLPTYDEWAVATFYDTDRHGVGSGGWWLSMYGKDTLPVGGAPGVGETSVGWAPSDDPFAWAYLPVGAYATSQSPWGLFDTSGTDSEFLETREPGVAGPMGAGAQGGEVLFVENTWPDYLGHFALVGRGNFRVATSVPSPGTVLAFAAMVVIAQSRRRGRR